MSKQAQDPAGSTDPGSRDAALTAEQRRHALGPFARAGFQDLGCARDSIEVLAHETGRPIAELIGAFALAADPDTALTRISVLAETHPDLMRRLGEAEWRRLAMLIGASSAFGDFFVRRPERLCELLQTGGRVIGADEARCELLAAVGVEAEAQNETVTTGAGAAASRLPIAALIDEAGWNALRARYRELLATLTLYDLERGRAGAAPEAFDEVSASLSGLAEATLEAALAIARRALLEGSNGSVVTRAQLDATRLSVIAMGKCGAGELNVVSDVDVMFVAEGAAPSPGRDTAIDTDAMLRIATRLASELMRAVHDPALEPPLWQVDANLRPEGRHGPLVRTLGSMMNYYERWAKAWEFQALLKARDVAGDRDLGKRFVELTRPMVWASSSREDFVASVQRMRERVTEHIAPDELEAQIKLGPGGLRDIEFSVQLLQLVHGQYDDRLHLRGTLPALTALVDGGYVARGDGERLASDYRQLRVLEHRLQLRELRRTALMPQDREGLRVLARAAHLPDAANGEELLALWRDIRLEVRSLHLKIFYAPLLSAVAALPDEEFVLGSEEARARLQSIGFHDPDGAMRHLTALTRGTSRAARIQRNLLPVLLQWLSEGTDPDFGLLAFRRVSEANSETPWYLRLLRDGSEAAERLTRVLSTSRFAAELLETVPEAVGWLERDESLRPVPLKTLLDEMRVLGARRLSVEAAAEAMRAVHRREVLRLALGRLVQLNDEADVAVGLDAAHTALLDGLLMALRADTMPYFEVSLIAMGRYGGGELGFASDIDLIAVYRMPEGASAADAPAVRRAAERLITELRRLVSDPRFTVDLDFDLRPEGKNGPMARSLDAYRAYYERWSLTWEAQALLRARPIAGDAGLGADFVRLADSIRYPESFSENDTREVRRNKARVEAERLPQGADPKRHLKLGPGGISDVEWLVQLLQLQHGAAHPEIRGTSTLAALRGAVTAGVLDEAAREQLETSWQLASRVRSAVKLWSGRGSDVLPLYRAELEGIARVLGLGRGQTTELEEQWFQAARRARTVFEREFYGYTDEPTRYWGA